MKQTIKKGIIMGLSFSLTVFLSAFTYAVWNGLNADDGDTLSAAKWNELVDKVEGVFSDEAGNVGIGVSIPGAKLDVRGGDLRVESENDANWATLSMVRPTDPNSGYLRYYGNSTSGLQLGVGGDNPIRFMTNGAEVLRMNSVGNVGIGTTAPTEKLHVNGNAKINGKLSIDKIYRNAALVNGEFSDGVITCVYSGNYTDCSCNDSNYEIILGGGYAVSGDMFRESRPTGPNNWRLACKDNVSGYPSVGCAGVTIVCGKLVSN